MDILCDERLAGQAFGNLLKNAAESVTASMEQGAGPSRGWVHISVSQEEGSAVISIEDNGLGWPEGARARLTEPYMTTRAKGTGLGLAIVKRVIEDHHGDLELNDRPDGARGALVLVRLPLAQNIQDFDASQTRLREAADGR